MRIKKLLVVLVLITCSNQVLDCQISGPKQPEYSKFESVNTTKMVNEQTGAFTYNLPLIMIPGPNGSGYPLSLSYHSGSGPEDEATWVGFGWTLNPGAITRQTSGFPDDYKGAEVKYYKKLRPIIRASKTSSLNIEMMSLPIRVDMNIKTSYDTYSKFNQQKIFGLTSDDRGKLSYNANSNGSFGFSFDINLQKILNDCDILEGKSSLLQQISDIKSTLSMAMNLIQTLKLDDYAIRLFPTVDGNEYNTKFNFTPEIRVDGIPILNAGIKTIPGINYDMTTTKFASVEVKRGYGYLYNFVEDDDKASKYDFNIENKSNPISTQDENLPIPFANKDNFIVSGEGVAGAFKLNDRQSGIFNIESNVSETIMLGGSLTTSIGITPFAFGIGGKMHGGSESKSSGAWLKRKNTMLNNQFKYKEYDNYIDASGVLARNNFFKFHNDLGNSLNYYPTNSSNDVRNMFDVASTPIYTDLKWNSLNFYPKLSPSVKNRTISHGGGSNNIAYYTFNELFKYVNVFTYFDDDNYKNFIATIDKSSISLDLIACFTVTNKEGVKYHYGLPVFNRNEKNLSFGIKNLNRQINPSSPQNFTIDNYICYYNVNNKIENNEVVTGYEMNEPYASTYLLTLILSPDYQDITGDGPTEDDFGTYTKFNYRRVSGSDNKKSEVWYKWRKPYNGLYYNQNSISEPQDDTGSMSSGEKEMYYLESIETKTHKAIFVTNKTSVNVHFKDNENYTIEALKVNEESEFIERKDLYSAVHDEALVSAQNVNSTLLDENQAPNMSEYLQKIILFAKNPTNPQQLIEKLQTTYFEYDYDYPIWSGQPSSYDYVGKLTLKKVWNEYGEVVENKVSPFEFNYEYDLTLEGKLDTRYEEIASFASTSNVPNFDEQPYYKPLNLDNWGNYQEDRDTYSSTMVSDLSATLLTSFMTNINQSRKYNNFNWVNQRPNPRFDPAAWNLKKITLPTLGQIHIHYEQNDYSNVQNRSAHLPFKIVSVAGDNVTVDISSEIELPSSDFEKEELLQQIVKQIKNDFWQKGKEVYSKVLYKLVGNNPRFGSCLNEYFEGWAKIKTVSNDAAISYDVLTGTITLRLEEREGKYIPEKLCESFVLNRRYGEYDAGIEINCDPCSSGGFGFSNYTSKSDAHGRLGSLLFSSEIKSTENFCKKIDFAHSVIKLPIPKTIPKKGGGIRVKRIFTLDKFDQNEDLNSKFNIYGTEYFYQDIINIDGKETAISSGVASSEPWQVREDNALIEFRTNKNLNEKSDLEQFSDFLIGQVSFMPDNLSQNEFPISKATLSSSNILFSKIISQDLSRKSGFNSTEFYTTKDFPYDQTLKILLNSGEMIKDAITFSEIKSHKDYLGSILNAMGVSEANSWLKNKLNDSPIGIGINYEIKEDYLTQNYQFILTNMAGQKKSVTRFDKNFQTMLSIQDDNSSRPIMTSSTKYEYFLPGEKIPIWENGSISKKLFGIDMDIYNYSSYSQTKGHNTNGNFDLNTLILGIIPAFIKSLNPGFQYKDIQFGYFVTNKIIRLPAILKKTITETDGVVQEVENVAFDPNSGQPVITKTVDGYNGLTLQQSTNHLGAITNYNILASTEYPSFGQKMFNQRMKFISNPADPGFLSDGDHNGKTRLYRRSRLNPTTGNFDYTIFADDIYPDIHGGFRKYLNEGDIINVKLSNSTNSGIDEFYKINRITTDRSISLIPLYGASQSTNDAIVDFIVIESGKNNILSMPIGNVVTYGNSNVNLNNTTPPTNSEHFSKLESLAEYINTFIHDETVDISCDTETGDSFEQTATLDFTSFEYPDIEIRDISGNILPISSLQMILKARKKTLSPLIMLSTDTCSVVGTKCGMVEYDITFVQSNGQSGLTFAGQTDVLIEDLNNLIQKMWSINLINEVDNLDNLCPSMEHGNIRLNNSSLNSYLYTIFSDFLNKEYLINHTKYRVNQFLDINYSVDKNSVPLIFDRNEENVIDKLYLQDFIVKFKAGAVTYAGGYNTSTKYGFERKLDNHGGVCSLKIGGSLAIQSYPNNDVTYADNDDVFSLASQENYWKDNIGEFLLDQDGKLAYEGNNESTYTLLELLPISSRTFSCENFFHDTYVKRCTLGLSCNHTPPHSSFEGEYVYASFQPVDLGDGKYTLGFGFYDEGFGFWSADCHGGRGSVLSCFEFVEPFKKNKTIANVLNAQFTTLSDDWDYDFQNLGYPNYSSSNSFTLNQRGQWRPKATFVFQTGRQQGTDIDGNSSNRIYTNAGVYDEFEFYNFQAPTSNSLTFTKTNEVLKYHPNGQPILVNDILNVSSSARYDARNNNINIVGTGSIYNELDKMLYFESFETSTFSNVSDGIVNGIAHTGTNSFQVAQYLESQTNTFTNLTYLKLPEDFDFTDTEFGGFEVKLWTKVTYEHLTPFSINSIYTSDYFKTHNANLKLDIQDMSGSSLLTTPLTFNQNALLNGGRTAQTGEWSLYSLELNDSDFDNLKDKELYFKIYTNSTSGAYSVYIDDVRLSPKMVNPMSYVYDSENDSRLVATLDAEHFATIHQYTPEGKLKRIVKETYNGIRTVSETNYNTPKQVRTAYQGGAIPPELATFIDYQNDLINNPKVLPNGESYKEFLGRTQGIGYESRKVELTKLLKESSLSGDSIVTPKGLNGKFDMFKLKITPQKSEMKMFDVDVQNDTLPDFEAKIKGKISDIENSVNSLKNEQSLKGFDSQFEELKVIEAKTSNIMDTKVIEIPKADGSILDSLQLEKSVKQKINTKAKSQSKDFKYKKQSKKE